MKVLNLFLFCLEIFFSRKNVFILEKKTPPMFQIKRKDFEKF